VTRTSITVDELNKWIRKELTREPAEVRFEGAKSRRERVL
jgi:hypothetical protein